MNLSGFLNAPNVPPLLSVYLLSLGRENIEEKLWGLLWQSSGRLPVDLMRTSSAHTYLCWSCELDAAMLVFPGPNYVVSLTKIHARTHIGHRYWGNTVGMGQLIWLDSQSCKLKSNRKRCLKRKGTFYGEVYWKAVVDSLRLPHLWAPSASCNSGRLLLSLTCSL